MESKSREQLIYCAKVAEQAERYNDMVKYMREVVKMDKGLEEEDRNLLSVAYKNVVGSYRSSWRVITGIENKTATDNPRHKHIVEYRAVVEAELNEVCQDILSLCDEYLIPKATTPDAQVFYKKMKGDYYRYLGEVLTGDERTKVAEAALNAYKDAHAQAQEKLIPTSPIRLGLGLNFSVFYYEILNQPAMAQTLARSTFDEAIDKVDQMNEAHSKDSTLILQLLRDNLTLWTSEGSQENQILDDDDDE